jgi:hypothetical protein
MAVAPQRQLPVPPIPVMPPEGTAPVTNQVDTAGQDLMSPTVMIQNYLQARGYQPTSENISRALAANQQDPGVIPGLRSDTPGVNPPVAAGSGGGGAPLPTPPIPPQMASEQLGPPELMGPPVGPDAGGGPGMGTIAAIVSSILGGGYGLKRYLGGMGGSPAAPAASAPTTPPAEAVGPASKTEPTTSAAPESPQEAALRKATDGSPVEGVKPVDPSKVAGRSQGPTTPTAGEAVPQVNFPSQAGRNAPPVQPGQNLPPGAARTRALAPRIVRPPLPRL